MSEGDVNLIRDEDVLRRMWQQTEDFGRKKEIRAHMYRLREERLRNLYSPEPTPAKGCEFSSGQAHVDSFADQTFQSMKSKEVRDASSPPKEFNYRGQDLKELSNAGWNVESEDKTTDDGRTHMKSVNANIEGRYDVEGGRGQFAAVDRQRQAVTEYQDDHTKTRRDETSSNTAAHEHVVRQTDDGTRFSSTTSSSNNSSKFQQVSSTVHETPAIQDYDQATHDTNRNEKVTKITNTEQNLRSSDFQNGELVSRKIDYPDNNTKVIVETRCLPDGTRVTSTRREFRAPAQSTRSEYQTRSESKSYSSQQKSDARESSSKIIQHTTDSHTDKSLKDSKTYQRTIDSRTDDIVDSQRHVDDNDFKRQLREYTVDDDTSSEIHRTNRRYDTKTSKASDYSKTEDDFTQTRYETRVNNKVIDRSTNVKDDYTQVHHDKQQYADNVDQMDRREVVQIHDDRNISHKDVKEARHVMDSNEKTHYTIEESRRSPDKLVRNIPKPEPGRNAPKTSDEPSRSASRDANNPRQNFPEDTSEQVHNISSVTDERTHKIIKDSKVEEYVERKTSNDHYQTTYQNDFQQKKVSNDWSPTHQAWASTLRADTPSTTRPSTRASSPGSRTFKSSTSSLRSSVSPDKTSRKPSSRGGSPSKVDRYSPTRTVTSDRHSNTHSSHSVTEVRTNKYTSPERKLPAGRSPAEYSPERKPQDSHSQRPSISPEKRPQNITRPSASPERKPSNKTPTDGFPKHKSPTRAAGLPSGPRQSPERQPYQPSSGKTCPDTGVSPSPHRPSTSPERKPTVDSSKPTFPRASPSPDRKRPNDSEKPKASPEREVGYKQPTPSREPQDFNKRPSVSPDRKPSYMRPTAASQPTSDSRSPSKPVDEPRSDSPFDPSQRPDRKYSPHRPSTSPERKPTVDQAKPSNKMPTDGFPAHKSPTRTAGLPSGPRQSPERQPYQPSSGKTCPDTGVSPSPHRPSTSPERKPTVDSSKPTFPRASPSPDRKRPNDSEKPKASPEREVAYKQPTPSRELQDFNKRPSVSPDRKPSYMRPTAASQPTSDSRGPSKPVDEPRSDSPFDPSQRPDRKYSKTVTQVKEDHYELIDEETKMNTRDKVPSPKRKSPSKDSPDFAESPISKGKSPSPQKKTVIVTENDELYGRIDKTVELVDITTTHDKQTEDTNSLKRTSKDGPEKKGIPSREISPTKFGTYDKKKPRDVTESTDVSTVTSTKDSSYDSLNRRVSTSPKKAPEPILPTKKSPRDSTSPMKSPTKDTKYKHTTDFINTEKTTEEVNKKTTTKERPRQLQTPSSSPTRKPKVETEPSTGQSSPTTSVSGFVYFGSPSNEKPIVTDLDDDFEPVTVYPDEPPRSRPDSLKLTRSISPSKIPCRSPSPEKHESLTKESLPRKSSLKKPSSFANPASPMDKPPSSFRVSPTEDKPDRTNHKVVKKDHPDEPESSSPMKAKPPLTRRETYEDRCRLILGMVDTENVTKETKRIKKPESNKSSPSVSPCESPIPQEPSQFPGFEIHEKIDSTKTDVIDFINNEQDNIIKTTKTREHKTKIPSRESSPTKIEDVVTKTTTVSQIDSTTHKKDKDVTTVTESKIQSTRQSPKKIRRPSESPERQIRKTPTDDIKVPEIPQTETSEKNPRGTSPTKLPRLSVSPERKQPTPIRDSPRRPATGEPKETSPTRTVNTIVSSKTITCQNTEFDDLSVNDDIRKDFSTTTKEKSTRTRVLESPTRQVPPTAEPSSERPRPRPVSSSPTEAYQPSSPSYEELKPEEQYPQKRSPSKPRQSPEKTTAISSTIESIEDTTALTIDNKKYKTTKSYKSPTRRTSQDVPRSVSPTKPSKTSPGVHKNEHSPERKQSKDVPVKSTELKESSPRDLPGYMRTTASTVSKNDTITITENISETTTSTVDQKHPSSRSSESPTRKASGPRAPSPTKISLQPSGTTTPKKVDMPSVHKQPSSPNKDDITKTFKASPSQDRSPTRPVSDKVPGYMKTTTSVSAKYETDEYNITTEDTQETVSSKTTEKKYPTSRQSPNHELPKPTEKSSPEYLRSGSPTKPTDRTTKRQDSPELKPGNQRPSGDSPKKKPHEKYPGEPSSTSETIGYKKTDKTFQFDTTFTTEDSKTTTSVQKRYPTEPKSETPGRSYTSPEKKQGYPTPAKDGTIKSPQDKPVEKTAFTRPSNSPDRKPSYMKPTAAVTSRQGTSTTDKDTQETYPSELLDHKRLSPRSSPTRQSPQKIPKDSLVSKPEEEPRLLRTPSPTKKTIKVTEVSTDFLMSEREQEILDRVHKSLRKLSPERKEKSPSREKSPNKTTTSLSDLDITSESVETNEVETEDLSNILEEQISYKTEKIRPGKQNDIKPKDQTPTKPSSRNVSPIKRAPSTPHSSVSTPQVEKSPESPTKSRSISPRKPLTQADRPQSPHGPRASGIRPRDQVPFNRKPTPATLSTYRIEKVITDVKKTNGVTKQNVSKTSTSSKSTTSRLISPQSTKPNEPESRRLTTPKGIKENITTKKETVTRTSSDSNIKPKKTSPQRMKSKPEIQVNDLSTKSPKYQKPVIKEPHSKLPAKPKSATALNTSTEDDDDIIIDVQQSKSSRENSPDRICPTPVNFADDVGTPRFPDEVSEPDDEYRRRSYHTIHETESVVDDIVEICEDEELFVKKTDGTSEYDDSLLSVNDKVSKFTSRIESVTKPKDTTKTFKDVERLVHSDFVAENIKSDECLLSVSEKVNKFARGPRDTKDNRSPSRKITDEYDQHTIYQDDYTKLSVNDKAHLFVETAESIKMPKVKLAQKVDRPDLSNVDESLRKDDCLLSVSDKVNKFVKTAENFLTETQEVDQKEKKIMEQHEKIIRQIVDDTDEDETYKINESRTTTKIKQNVEEYDSKPTTYKKEATPQAKGKDYISPKSKPADRAPTVKITTLRSSEAVKKAKALFENIASTQKTKDVTQTTSKTTKLTDIGVVRKSPKTDSTTVLHPSVEYVSPNVNIVDSELDTAPHTPRSTERPTSGTLTRPRHPHVEEKPRASPNRLTAQSPEVPRAKSPMRQSVETTTTRTVLSRYPAATRAESPRNRAESPRYRAESPRHRPETEKSDKVPGYLRPTKTSQIKEETKIVEESEVSSRRGSGKFGVELRRTSIERSTVSSERRRSVEHHQPCIEDIFDLDLLEQMLEKVVGYEQRRRIRSQIRVVKNDTEHVETQTHIRTKHTSSTSKSKTSEHHTAKSPERMPKTAPQRALSPERQSKTPQRTHPERSQPSAPVMNGHSKEPVKPTSASRLRPHSPEKLAPKSIRSAKSPARQPSPVKKRTVSPTKVTPKPKSNRFNEYASAYMKKVGLNETDKIKSSDKKNKKATETKKTISHETQDRTSQEFTTTNNFTATSERTSSRDVIEIVHVNGKRTPSPEKITGILRKPQSPDRRVYNPVGRTLSPEGRDHSPVSKAPERRAHSPEQRVYSPVGKNHVSDRKAQSPERKVYSPVNKAPERKAQSPERKAHSPERKAPSPERKALSPERKVLSPAERLYQRTPSPEFKRQKPDTKKETIIKTVYDIEKKISPKPVQEEKPSWITNRNLKKITSETRTFSSKKLETEKPKYRATSPSKVISKPIDVITSSYGPGPLDADGRPLFGIKALRNGATNVQVKGTVIRQEFHSRNGGEPEGTVSVTAYSSQPDELEQLMAAQGVEPPSRIHGLSAITTTKKFGGDTGISMSSVNTKEERASLDQFTHTDRKMESQIENMETGSYDTQQEVIDSMQIDSRKSDRTDRRERRKEERVTEVRKGQKEERREKMERREDKKTVRQSSVKSLTEKFIKSANDSGKTDRSTYPKAGLILRTTSTLRDSISSDEAHPALARTDSEHSMGSVEDVVVTKSTDRGGAVTTTTRTSRHHGPTTTQRTSTVTHHEPIITTKKTTTVITSSQEPVVTKVVTQGPVVTKTVTGQRGGSTVTERSFLDSSTKVTGVQDILTRMKNADIVIEDGDSVEDSEARALLNKFLGATVLMAGMQGYVSDQPTGKLSINQESVRSSGKVTSTRVEDIDLEQCWDERLLRKLLDECTDYDQRRRLRARIRSLMAEQEACAAAVTDALGAAHITSEAEGSGAGAESGAGDAREEEEVTVTSSVRRDSSEKTSSSSTTKTSKVIESVSRTAPKPVSPFAKFRQLEKQNSTNSPNPPQSPQSPRSPSQPYFKFTDPALQCSALTIKERLLQWCRDKTRNYENVKLENFSTSWADGLAFCALLHHFLPDAFDYSRLTPDQRRHNFTLAFKLADEKAGIYPLLDVDDMVAMRKPDWKCVFTYVQAIYRRFKDEP